MSRDALAAASQDACRVGTDWEHRIDAVFFLRRAELSFGLCFGLILGGIGAMAAGVVQSRWGWLIGAAIYFLGWASKFWYEHKYDKEYKALRKKYL